MNTAIVHESQSALPDEMVDGSQGTPVREPRWARLDSLAVLVIGLVLAGVYFHNVAKLGLYEDDYVPIAEAINWDWPQVWAKVYDRLTHWHNGRPLSDAMQYLGAYLLFGIGGLPALYVMPFALVMTAAVLLYVLTKRFLGRVPAFLAGLTWVVLPTDTLRLCLHGTPLVQGAVIFQLAAILLYVNRRFVWCYIAVAVGLLFHETGTLAILVAPLLSPAHPRTMVKRIALHVLCWAVAVGSVMTMRATVMNEDRTRGVVGSPLTTVSRMVESVQTGTWTHLKLVVEKIRHVRYHMHHPVGAAAAAIMVGAGVYLVVHATRRRPDTSAYDDPPAPIVRIALWTVVSVLCFAIPYMTYITDPYWPSNHIAGRMASVHTAAGVGVSMFIAAVAGFLVKLSHARPLRRVPLVTEISVAPLVVLIALLGGWGHLVQLEYVQSWQNQRQYWSTLVRMIGDIGEGTIVMVEFDKERDLEFTWIIGSHSWADSLILDRVYQFPREWSREPRVFCQKPEWWRPFLRTDNGRIYWRMPPGQWAPHEVELTSDNFILLRSQNARLHRVEGSIDLAGVQLVLKDPPPVQQEPTFPRRPLYNLLIEADELRGADRFDP